LEPMSVRAEHVSSTKKIAQSRPSTRYLVIGRDGALALGNLLSKLFRSRNSAVEDVVGFDHRRELTLYEIKVQGSGSRSDYVDTMVCLSNDSLDYETLLRTSGTLILDANTVSGRPRRNDIEIVAVPAYSLSQDIVGELSEESRTRLDPSLPSLLGTIEAIEGEYPDAGRLKRALEGLDVEQTGPFLTAVYRGYDWLQEMQMRGKSANGGIMK
jgi:hypothetical protein